MTFCACLRRIYFPEIFLCRVIWMSVPLITFEKNLCRFKENKRNSSQKKHGAWSFHRVNSEDKLPVQINSPLRTLCFNPESWRSGAHYMVPDIWGISLCLEIWSSRYPWKTILRTLSYLCCNGKVKGESERCMREVEEYFSWRLMKGAWENKIKKGGKAKEVDYYPMLQKYEVMRL